MLVLLTGLPGTGKSSVAEAVAASLPAAILSADPVDAALVRAGIEAPRRPDVIGLEVLQALAEEHVRLGLDVVVDAVNPFVWVREAYRSIAARRGTPFVVIATICSDPSVHRERVETRRSAGASDADWAEVERQADYYEPPAVPPLRLDAARDLGENVERALAHVHECARLQP